jgi:hypothetical protein
MKKFFLCMLVVVGLLGSLSGVASAEKSSISPNNEGTGW